MEFVNARMPTPPIHPLPRGVCDTHTHVFESPGEFPFMFPSSYAPPAAPVAVHAQMLASVGVDYGVVVQPAPYGTDARALVHALVQRRGSLRGIAVADASIRDAELAALDAAGVRGLRFNEVLDSGTGKPFLGSVGVSELESLAPRLRELGWHAQIWARCEDVGGLVRRLAPLKVPMVFEHMTSVTVSRGVADPAFQDVLALLRDGRLWVKLAVCRNSKAAPDYDDLRPFHDALVEANAARLVWASDWPFVRMGDASPDVGHLLDLFCRWVPDASTQRTILVDNPAALYGFDRVAVASGVAAHG